MDIIVEFVFVAVGGFIRWILSGRKVPCKQFMKTGPDYWKNVSIGGLFWVLVLIAIIIIRNY